MKNKQPSFRNTANKRVASLVIELCFNFLKNKTINARKSLTKLIIDLLIYFMFHSMPLTAQEGLPNIGVPSKRKAVSHWIRFITSRCQRERAGDKAKVKSKLT